MTVGAWLRENERVLRDAGVTTARLDTLVLLADELARDKSWLLAHPEHVLQIEQLKKLSTKITQRADHVPLAYLRGHAEFYGREFTVDANVLVPRPESEDMIELLKQAASFESQVAICDIGTGSGCLAITAKLELPGATVIATDIDKSCLNTARENAARLGADVIFLQGDLLQPIRKTKNEKRKTIIVANLPYVPLDYPINQAAAHEPKRALFSGTDGLDHYREFFAQVPTLTVCPACIITESLAEQHAGLVKIAELYNFTLQTTKGLAQLFVANSGPSS